MRWAHGGDGVASPQTGPLAGAVVFVPGAVPGDVVSGRVAKRGKRWVRLRVDAITRPSPERVAAACEHQARCGGCPWMLGSARAQAGSRLAILQGEAVKRLGWDAAEARAKVRLAAGEGQRLGYRVRLRVAWEVRGDSVALGFRGRGSHALVDVTTCVIATPRLQAALAELRLELAARCDKAVQVQRGEASLLQGDEGVAIQVRPDRAPPYRLGPPEVTVTYPASLAPNRALAGVKVSLPADAFAQANPAVMGQIIEQVSRVADEAFTAGARSAVELYAGSGTLTPALLSAGLAVTAYEVAAGARQRFERVTGPYGSHAALHACDLDVGLPQPPPDPPVDMVLLDPPRHGAQACVPWIAASAARWVVMVSCDVATALRDSASLVAQGGFEVRSVTGYDMFPHTGHQELVIELTRGELAAATSCRGARAEAQPA